MLLLELPRQLSHLREAGSRMQPRTGRRVEDGVMEAFSESGIWWLPGQKGDAIAGTLTFAKDDGLRLGRAPLLA